MLAPLRTTSTLLLSGVLAALLLSSYFVAPLMLDYDPYATDAAHRLEPPSASHLFGTDDLGRDILIRVLVAGRASMTIAIIASLVSCLTGTLLGGIAGISGGRIDSTLMRIVDLFLSFPPIFVALFVGMLLQGNGLGYLRSSILPSALLIGGLTWMELARIVRINSLGYLHTGYVEAAIAIGAGRTRVLLRHVVPQILPTILVQSTMLISAALLMESGLSYLGFGVQPPTPTWGNMLQRSQSHFYSAPWLLIYPSLFLCLTATTISILGDALHVYLNPTISASRRTK